ncbi:hypothetical protein GF374_02835 [Candidatus Woesearchaeota archaeon]|nr:hypothetical protein [Candidatus Woesearchaeota archaeon]
MVFLLKNKKAVEWPMIMIYVIFTAILFIMGIFMIFSVADVSITDVDKDLDELYFTLLADRIINSADCAALQEIYTDELGNTKYQVRPGTVMWSKFYSNADDISDCIGGKKLCFVLEDLKTDNTMSGCTGGMSPEEISIQDSYFVQIYYNDENINNGLLTIQFKNVKP